jgi:hypothetical protein
MKFILTAFFLIFSAVNLVAQNCDCTIYPVAKECRETCAMNFLQKLNKENLVKIFKIDTSTACMSSNQSGHLLINS